MKVVVCAAHLPGRGADAFIFLDGMTPTAPDAEGRAKMTENNLIMTF